MTDLEITLPNGLRHYLLVTHHFALDRAPWKDLPFTVEHLLKREYQLQFQIDIHTFFKAHNGLCVGGFPEPHYLHSIISNLICTSLHSVAHDVK